jgi:AraC-like DNA-binding protein
VRSGAFESNSDLDVSAGLLRQVVTHAAREGVETGALLQQHGLSQRLVDDPDARVPAACYLAVQDSVAELLNDPHLGLHLGQQTQPGHFSILGYLMMNCRYLGEALHQSARYYQFIGTIFEWRTRFSPTSFTVIARSKLNANHASRHCVESAFAATVAMMRALTGVPIEPRRVAFVTPAPEATDEYESYFRCPVAFDRKQNEITFALATGRLPVLAPNPELRNRFQSIADEMLSSFESRSSISDSVFELIARAPIPAGVTIREVAGSLGMSVRKLQYALRETGTDFSGVRRRAIVDLAAAHLSSGVSVGETAFALGLADPTSFSRMFKRATGVSPREYRLGGREPERLHASDPTQKATRAP